MDDDAVVCLIHRAHREICLEQLCRHHGCKHALNLVFCSIHLRQEERLVLRVGRDGGLQNFELHGLVTLRISDETLGRIRVQLENKDTRGIQLQVQQYKSVSVIFFFPCIVNYVPLYLPSTCKESCSEDESMSSTIQNSFVFARQVYFYFLQLTCHSASSYLFFFHFALMT